MVYFEVLEVEFFPFFCSAVVGVFVDEFSFGYDVAGVFHTDAVGVKPEFAVTEVEVGYLGAGGLGHIY